MVWEPVCLGMYHYKLEQVFDELTFFQMATHLWRPLCVENKQEYCQTQHRIKENIYFTHHVSYNDIHRGGLQWKSAHIPTQNICLHPGAIVIHSLLLVPVAWYHRNGIFPKQLLCESGNVVITAVNIEPENLYQHMASSNDE